MLISGFKRCLGVLWGNRHLRQAAKRCSASKKRNSKPLRIYWIDILEKPGKLGMTARPKGGEWLSDEIQKLVNFNISTIISHLEQDEESELDITDESVLCRQNAIDFISYPIKDRNVPKDLNSYLDLITEIDKRLDKGEKIVIHCRMGIGRTGITAASVLTKNGWGENEVFRCLSEIRTLEMPDTQEQIEFIKEIKDALQQSLK